MKTFYKLILTLLLFVFLKSCESKKKVFFKEDFEKYEAQKQPEEPWIVSGEGITVVDTLKAYSGKKSIHFKSGEGFKNRAFISLKNIFPKETKSYHGSMKMYVEEASPDGIHWTMIQASGKTTEGFHAEVRYGGQHNKRIMANYDTKEIKSDCWHHTQFKMPEKKWVTLQWYMNREENNMKLWLEGTLIHELNVNNIDKGCLENENKGKWTFPFFEIISLGWVDYQKKGGERKIWIDDVILSEN